MVFPKDASGKRSTMGLNCEVFAASLDSTDAAAAKATRADAAKWRRKYAKHVVANVEVSARSREAAVQVAQDGLRHLHSALLFERDGSEVPLDEAMAKFTDSRSTLESMTVTGLGRAGGGVPLAVPYKGKELRGDSLRAQIEQWVKGGQCELDTGAALLAAVDNPSWCADISDRTFVLLGASSAMGPLPLLLQLGAHVVAVDIDRAAVWEKILTAALESPGKLTFPMRRPLEVPGPPTVANAEDIAAAAAVAGCNLLTETPEIRSWLLNTLPEDSKVVLNCLAYLDGGDFVRISAAMDAIAAALTESRPNTTLAFLCTPTDAHLVPSTARAAAARNFRSLGLFASAFKLWPGLPTNARRAVLQNDGDPSNPKDRSQVFICDAIVPQQGPNYILAKRIQHWRCVVASAAGTNCSASIAPATSTKSVLSNKAASALYRGLPSFKPMEVFEEGTSRALMGMLLIHDLCNAQASSTKLQQPLELFARTAFHGGAWRCGVKFGALGIPATVIACLKAYLVRPYLIAYNAIQSVGWALMLAKAVSVLMTGGGLARLFAHIRPSLLFFQRLAGLEVLHSLLGMVRSPLPTVTLQVFSRLALVAVVEHAADATTGGGAAVTRSVYLALMAVSWGVTEVVRYSTYCLSALGISDRNAAMKLLTVSACRYLQPPATFVWSQSVSRVGVPVHRSFFATRCSLCCTRVECLASLEFVSRPYRLCLPVAMPV